jgi:hypothetical protein
LLQECITFCGGGTVRLFAAALSFFVPDFRHLSIPNNRLTRFREWQNQLQDDECALGEPERAQLWQSSLFRKMEKDTA